MGITLGHHFGRRLGGPVERMRMGIPFSDEGHQALCQTIEVREIADTQPLTLHNAKPLLDLVHPRTVHRQKVTGEAGMSRQPSLNAFPFMDTRVIEDQIDASH